MVILTILDSALACFIIYFVKLSLNFLCLSE